MLRPIARSRYYLVDPLFAHPFFGCELSKTRLDELPVIIFARYPGITRTELPGTDRRRLRARLRNLLADSRNAGAKQAPTGPDRRDGAVSTYFDVVSRRLSSPRRAYVIAETEGQRGKEEERKDEKRSLLLCAWIRLLKKKRRKLRL